MTRRSWRRWGPTALCAVVLALLYFVFDQPLSDALAQVREPWLTTIADLVSELRGVVFFGAASLALWGAGLALKRTRLRDAGAIMLAAVAASAVVVAVIKPIVGRAGPPHGIDQPQEDESWLERRWGRFPSGHTAAAFAAAQGLASVYPATAPFGCLVGALVAGERLYRQSHFASDCFAGGWIGWATARWVARRFRRRARTAPPPASPDHSWTLRGKGC